MAAWLPILKASLPYITQIVTTAIPAFTTKQSKEKISDVVERQIEELQAAVTNNAESVKILATQLKETFEVIDVNAAALQKEVKALKSLVVVAVVIAFIGGSIAIWSLLSR